MIRDIDVGQLLRDAMVEMILKAPVVTHRAGPPPILRHECRPQCDFFEKGDVFICRRTNNFHHCSAATCSSLVADDQCQTCEIVGKQYPLDFVVSASSSSSSSSSSGGGGGGGGGKNSGNRNCGGSCGGGWGGSSGLLGKKRFSQTAVPAKAKRARLGGTTHTIEVQEAQTVTLLRSILTSIEVSAAAATTDDNAKLSLFDVLDALDAPANDSSVDTKKKKKTLFDALVQTSQQLWRQCIHTKVYEKNPYKYRHNYHVLVVLYHSLVGFRTLAVAAVGTNAVAHGSGVCLIEANAHLKKWLPPLRMLFKKNIKGCTSFKTGSYTKTSKIFLACMREIYSVT